MVSYFIGESVFDRILHVHADGQISRIVPGFLVQTGDKTGTGGGGESIYGGWSLFRSGFRITTTNLSQNLSRMKSILGYDLLTEG
jgi:hypothetical protein